MKELSIEDKAKRYDEALERASNLHKDAVEMENNMTTKTCEIIFPELKESEDDRIRKCVTDIIKENTFSSIYGVTKEECLAWLEKQDKQKPTWSEEDENRVNRLIAYFEDKESFTAEDDIVYANWLNSLKDRVQSQNTWKPSDKQIKVCKEVYADILSAKGFDVGTVNNELNRLEEQLKKLRKE